MKKSEFKNQIKEEILSILKESSTMVDKTTNPNLKIPGKDPKTVKAAIDSAKKTNQPVNIAEDNYKMLDRMDGLITINFVKSFQANVKIIYDELYEEGFEKEEIKEYFEYIIERTLDGDIIDEGRGRPKKSESKKEDDEDEEDVKDDWEKPEADEDGDKDKEPSKAELAKMKKDSIATISNKLQKIVKQMKDKVEEYKTAEGDKKEAIKDELKELTKEKKKLENQLS